MMFADKTRVLINFPTAWAQTDFDVKGVYRAESAIQPRKCCFRFLHAHNLPPGSGTRSQRSRRKTPATA